MAETDGLQPAGVAWPVGGVEVEAGTAWPVGDRGEMGPAGELEAADTGELPAPRRVVRAGAGGTRRDLVVNEWIRRGKRRE